MDGIKPENPTFMTTYIHSVSMESPLENLKVSEVY